MKLYTASSKEAQGIVPKAHARLSIQTQAIARYMCKKFIEKLSLTNIHLPLDFKYVPARLGYIAGGPKKGEYCMPEARVC